MPKLAAGFLDRWTLRPDGPPQHGMTSLVLPVLRADGTPAVLKLQPVDEENTGEPIDLRTWHGHGAVRLLDHDWDTGTMLLERLDANSPLSTVGDDTTAVQILAELLARLVAVQPAEQRLVRTCAAAVAEVVGEPGGRLLHWDLHYDNILAGQREPWLAMDPKPLTGDPGFELLPALDNRWDELVATGDVARAVLRRFDQITEVLGLDRGRVTAWTLGRVLQNALCDVEDGETALDPAQVAIATALLHRQAQIR